MAWHEYVKSGACADVIDHAVALLRARRERPREGPPSSANADGGCASFPGRITRLRFRTFQICAKDLRALPGHPEPAVSWHSGFRGGAHARRKATPVHHAARRRGGRVAARGAGAAARAHAAHRRAHEHGCSRRTGSPLEWAEWRAFQTRGGAVMRSAISALAGFALAG